MQIEPEILEQLRRASGIDLGADGGWRFRGAPVPNERVQHLFHRCVRVRGDGEVVLEVGSTWCYVECETVARFVVGLRVEGDALVLRFADGEARPAEAPRLGFGPDGRCYVWERPDSAPAVLLHGAHLQLAGMLEGTEERPILPLEGAHVEIELLAAAPGPAAAPPKR